VKRFAAFLADQGVLTVEAETALRQEIEAELDRAVQFAKDDVYPSLERGLADVFGQADCRR
jgi:TPP-dependent pyruvate/acetoin dehydrogenase alpha subunit